jgi:ribonuclease HI
MGRLSIYTDGSTLKNGKKGATGGIGIYIEELDIRYHECFKISPITNNRCELTAILRGLELVEKAYIESENKNGNRTESENKNGNGCRYENEIIVITDSQYSIGCLTKWVKQWEKNGWKTSKQTPVENQDIIKPLLVLFRKMNVKIIHEYAHKTEPLNIDKQSITYKRWYGNNEADRLSNIGRELGE